MPQITADLERSLRSKKGWQRLVKRGVHTPHTQEATVSGTSNGPKYMKLRRLR